MGAVPVRGLKSGDEPPGPRTAWSAWPFGRIVGAARAASLAAGARGVNLERVGDYNARQVLQSIRCGAASTRLAIARATGLTVPTVANITTRLIALGLVTEAGRTSGRGQPARILRVRCEALFSIGISLDDAECSLAIIDLGGRIRIRSSISRKALDLQRMSDLLTTVLFQTSASDVDFCPERVIGIGIVDSEDRPAKDGIVPMLEGALKRSAIVVASERKACRWVLHCGDLGEAVQASETIRTGPKPPSFVYLTLDQSADDVFMYDRRPRTRRSESGGRTNGIAQPRIRVASVKSLASRSGYPGDEGLRRADSPLCASNATLDRWLDDCLTTLVPILDAIGRLIDPGEVIIGGRLQQDLVERLATRLGDALAGDLTLPPMTIRPSTFGPDAALVGAAALPFIDQLFPCDAVLMKSGSAEPAVSRG